jgi:molybdopterin-guanine dinucleotide biosynthesis protein A
MLGVVLAGGGSRRMGRTKALIEVGGIPMARRVADALLAGGCTGAVIVGGRAEELGQLGLPVVPDEHPGEGPLGGVLTALALVAPAPGTIGRGAIFVAPCDLPFLRASVVRSMIDALDDRADAIVARGDRLEPALAIWRESARAPLRADFEAGGRALHLVLRSLTVVEVAVDPAVVWNVNTPGDLSR